MTTVKMFTPGEIGLTDGEERDLAEYVGGSADCCYKYWIVQSEEEMREEYGEEYDDEDCVFPSMNRKLLATGLVNVGERVMIDLCW